MSLKIYISCMSFSVEVLYFFGVVFSYFYWIFFKLELKLLPWFILLDKIKLVYFMLTLFLVVYDHGRFSGFHFGSKFFLVLHRIDSSA